MKVTATENNVPPHINNNMYTANTDIREWIMAAPNFKEIFILADFKCKNMESKFREIRITLDSYIFYTI